MFENTISTLESAKGAWQLIYDLRAIYQQCKLVHSRLALYQSGSDPVFNAAINAIFSAQERAELAAMLSEINALMADWETNHRAAIGLE